MSLSTTILGLISRAGIPFLSGWLAKFNQPKLAIRMESGSYSSGFQGFVDKSVPEHVLYNRPNAIGIYQGDFSHSIFITNNSPHVSYNITGGIIISGALSPFNRQQIDNTQPLLAHQRIQFDVKKRATYQAEVSRREQVERELSSGNNIDYILLEYENQKGGKFFTKLYPSKPVSEQLEYGKR